MRTLTLILTLCFSQISQANSTNTLKSFDPLQWQHRLIVMHQIQNEEAALSLINDKQADINERHILWFMINKNTVETNYHGQLSNDFAANIKKRYRLKPNEIILIGKDGGVKSRINNINLIGLFSEIDAMPMRRYEMQQSNGS